MSMSLNFEPHSWYMGAAIEDRRNWDDESNNWSAYIENDNFYVIDVLHNVTLEGLKAAIRGYHLRRHNGYGERYAKRRLKYLRGEIKAGCISFGELDELQLLTDYIEPGDIELLEWAGVL